jgi:hypothetical protein
MERGITCTRRSRPGLLLALCAAATALPAAPAAGQQAASANAVAGIVEQLTLTKNADLDFGQVAVNGAGTILMTASAAPTCTVSANLIKYGACQPAVFEGYGQSGRTVRVKIPGSQGITLTGPGGATMKITAVTTDTDGSLGPPTTGNASSNGFRRYQIVSADGAFLFRLAGTLNVAAGQRLGLYSATFDVEIAYE